MSKNNVQWKSACIVSPFIMLKKQNKQKSQPPDLKISTCDAQRAACVYRREHKTTLLGQLTCPQQEVES